MYTLRQGQWIPQTMPSIVIICKMMSAPVLKFATQGRITIWSVGGAETTAKGKRVPAFCLFCSYRQFSICFQIPLLQVCLLEKRQWFSWSKVVFLLLLTDVRASHWRACVHARQVTSVMSDSATQWTVAHTLLCPWDSPGNDTGAGCHALLRGIFPIQGLNLHLLCLLHWQIGSLPHCHLGSPEEHAMLKNESMIILGPWLSPGLYVVQEGWVYCIKLSAKHSQVSPPTLESGSLLTGLLGGLSIILSELFPETL